MSQASVDRLPAFDPAALTAAVRQDQRSPTFELLDWSVRRLSDQGIINPDGLLCVSGHGRDGDGVKPWSLVVKTLKDPGAAQAPAHLWYWQREALAAESGILAALPGPIAAPRLYGVTRRENDAWIWMEHITDAAARRWSLEDYAFAARQIGRDSAAYALGMPLPTWPWLCRGHARAWAEGLPPHDAWQNPFVQRHFAPHLQARVLQLWAERAGFYAILDRLPQIFCHFDYQRRNLLRRARADGRPELVAVDWALCGIGPLGGELFSLVGSSALLLEWEPARLGELDDAAFAAYIAGLEEAGWQGSVDLVRLGYTAWMALWCGLALPAATAFWCIPERAARALQQFGHTQEEAAAAWATLCAYSLERADEARRLMAVLSLA